MEQIILSQNKTKGNQNHMFIFMGYTVHILKVTLFMPLGAHVYVYLYVYTAAVKNIMLECILPAARVDLR